MPCLAVTHCLLLRRVAQRAADFVGEKLIMSTSMGDVSKPWFDNLHLLPPASPHLLPACLILLSSGTCMYTPSHFSAQGLLVKPALGGVVCAARRSECACCLRMRLAAVRWCWTWHTRMAAHTAISTESKQHLR